MNDEEIRNLIHVIYCVVELKGNERSIDDIICSSDYIVELSNIGEQIGNLI